MGLLSRVFKADVTRMLASNVVFTTMFFAVVIPAASLVENFVSRKEIAEYKRMHKELESWKAEDQLWEEANGRTMK